MNVQFNSIKDAGMNFPCTDTVVTLGIRLNPAFLVEGQRPRSWEQTNNRFSTVADAKDYATENARVAFKALQYRICIGHRPIMVSKPDGWPTLRWQPVMATR